ncbi:MAG: two-component system, sporulation sensor kinase [Eubacteriales bacterium]|nr:two-component system, sporulation sensor kinase [Eubacteriales bacterium]
MPASLLREKPPYQRYVLCPHPDFSALDQLPLPVLIADSHHRILLASEAFFYLTGYSREEILGHRIDTVMAKLVPGKNINAHPLVLEHQFSINTRVIITGKNQQTFPALLHVIPYSCRDIVNGTLTFIENMQSQTARAELENIAPLVLDSLSTGLVVVNPEEKIILFNRAAEKITGLKGYQVTGENLTVGLRKLPHLRHALKETLHTLSPCCSREIGPAGEEQTFPFSTFPLLSDNCLLQGAVAFLGEENPTNAGRQQALQEMAATVAHRLRNPLTSVNCFLQLMKDKLPPESREHQLIPLIQTEIQEANSVVEEMIALAHRPLRSHQQENVHSLIQAVLREMQPFLSREGLEVKTKYCPFLPPAGVEKNSIILVLRKVLLYLLTRCPQQSRLTIKTCYQPGEKMIAIYFELAPLAEKAGSGRENEAEKPDLAASHLTTAKHFIAQHGGFIQGPTCAEKGKKVLCVKLPAG